MGTSRRKRYWVDIRTQGPFLLKIGTVWTLGLLLLCTLLYYLSDEELGRSFYSVHLRIRNTWQILLPAVLLSGGVSFLVTITASILLAVRESHRLGGPVFKFTRLFRQLGEGSFDPEFRFRKGDILAPLGESYRQALEANRNRILEMQGQARRAEASLSAVQEKIAARIDGADEKALLSGPLDELSRLRKALDAFDLGAR